MCGNKLKARLLPGRRQNRPGVAGLQKWQESVAQAVRAWATANRLVLGQEAAEEKSNENTAIPKLLALLELHGCIVTALTRGRMPTRDCRADRADQKADYVLGLKGNQGSLREAVDDYFTAPLRPPNSSTSDTITRTQSTTNTEGWKSAGTGSPKTFAHCRAQNSGKACAASAWWNGNAWRAKTGVQNGATSSIPCLRTPSGLP
ncbi:MAG: ISAs1 family transposase, partial [Methylococcales bacterium]